MKTRRATFALIPLVMGCCAGEVSAQRAYHAVPLTEVTVGEGFWGRRMQTNRQVSIPHTLQQCEETGRIANFAIAGGLMAGPFRGRHYDDSDVFKIVEGATYSLAAHPDPQLEQDLDELIAKIAAAQEDDGYLYTVRTSIRDGQLPPAAGPTRWSKLAYSHELYNVGHLYEAAVAHHLATGKQTLLNVAIRNAELIDATFGPGKLPHPPGHQEIEIGLVKLYGATGEKRYLDLARFFIDARGRADGRELYGVLCQDHKPVIEQDQAVGHAVRAAYLYCGIADVAALTGDADYLAAVDRLWEDVTHRKMFLTGGIGTDSRGEAFGQPYDLPNATAYAETCAAVAHALWNQRMFLLHGDARYIDVLERVIYNGFLAGVSLDGDSFFYPNPLEADGRQSQRRGWFETACCPSNVVRFIPSIAGMFYATAERALYVNLYGSSRTRTHVAGSALTLTQQTDYPWDGWVRIEVECPLPTTFALHLRIPGWSQGWPVPGDLYRYADASPAEVALSVNGEPVAIRIERGYGVVDREWKSGDRVELHLAMPIRRVLAHDAVEADRGRVAIERGPIVYCIEGADYPHGRIAHLILPDEAALEARHEPDLLGGITVVRGGGQAVHDKDNSPTARPAELTMIPYYAWAHRGAHEMRVWIPRF